MFLKLKNFKLIKKIKIYNAANILHYYRFFTFLNDYQRRIVKTLKDSSRRTKHYANTSLKKKKKNSNIYLCIYKCVFWPIALNAGLFSLFYYYYFFSSFQGARTVESAGDSLYFVVSV